MRGPLLLLGGPLLLLAACARSRNAARAAQEEIDGFKMAETRSGRLDWTLEADRADIDEGSSTARLVEPRLEFYTAGAPTSGVQARRGLLDTETHDISLVSGVEARQNSEHRVLFTESLRYISKRRKIVTEDPFRIESPDASITGRGLEANPDFSDIRLKGQRTLLHGHSQKKG